MSEADVLRRAAERLRGLAEAATPGPWTWEGDYPDGHCPHNDEWGDHGPNLVTVATKHVVGRTMEWDAPIAIVISSTGYDASSLNIRDEDADYIAVMHPEVAKALAVWLNETALRWDWVEERELALTLARLVLGEES